MQAWQFVRRPKIQGAQVAVWADEKVLLIRTSYRSEYAFPGGLMKANEDPLKTAVRELLEETEIQLPRQKLTLVMSVIEHREFSSNLSIIYDSLMDHIPETKIDHGEIVESCFVTPRNALQMSLSQSAKLYLLWVIRENSNT